MSESETIQQIPLSKITPNPENRRVGGFDPVKLQELADSIKESGVLQPIVVRKQLSNGGFELVFGERRLRAAKLAGLTEVPALVREMDDMQVLRAQTIENLQREDVHPLDEADGFARLLDRAGYEVEQIAKEVGKSASYVYQRLKLRELIEPARKLMIEGAMAAGHAVLIARLPGPQQANVLARVFDRRDPPSVRDLSDYIQREVLMELGKASWKLDDANLLPAAGPCSLCPKRAGSAPALFADVCTGRKDYCTDRVCFQAKTKAMVDLRRAELKEQPHLEMHSEYRDYQENQRDDRAGILRSHQVEQCKKDDPKAQRVLDLSTGRVTWGKKQEQRSYRYQPTAKEKAEAAKRKEEERREMAFRQALYREICTAAEDVFDAELFRHVVQKFWKYLWGDGQARLAKEEGWENKGDRFPGWEDYGAALIAKMDEKQLALMAVKISIVNDLGWGRKGDDDLRKVAKLLAIDVAAVKKQALAGLKAPKPAPAGKRGKKAAEDPQEDQEREEE